MGTGRAVAIGAALACAPLLAAQAPAGNGEEAAVWASVRAIDTPVAYRLYAHRFPDGAHIETARGHLPPLAAPPPPPRMTREQAERLVAQLARRPADPCSDDTQATSPDIDAFRVARASGRPADYETYLSQYPAGICAGKARKWQEAADRLRRDFVPVPGIGPLNARRLPGLVVTGDDYPIEAYVAKQAGAVTAEWDVSAIGTVESCHVTGSSGFPLLDSATCKVITSRVRYDPARDGAGATIPSTDRVTVRWSPPAKPPQLIILDAE